MFDENRILQRFIDLIQVDDDGIDLARTALLIAATEYPELDVERELGVLDSLAAGASGRLGEERNPVFCLNSLSEYLFDEVGFSGNQDDYYDPRNSFLNEGLSRRSGIPITLSLVYLEVGKRLGIPLVGVGMPGHFLLRHRDEENLLVDPFYRGILLSQEECADRLSQLSNSNVAWDPSFLTPVSNRQFITRILGNLKAIYFDSRDFQRALGISERLVALEPSPSIELRDRGLVKYRLGRQQEAKDDLDAYLEIFPDGPDSGGLRQLVDQLAEALDNS